MIARRRRAAARRDDQRRALAASARRLDRGTKPGDALGRLQIPRVKDSWVMVQGTGDDALRSGPGHYGSTPLPGQPGTFGVAGHRTTYDAPFRHIDRLRKGDRIEAFMPYGRFVYRVEGTLIVRPEDVKVLKPVSGQRIVLTACHPLYSAQQRIVVTARLVSARARTA